MTWRLSKRTLERAMEREADRQAVRLARLSAAFNRGHRVFNLDAWMRQHNEAAVRRYQAAGGREVTKWAI